MAEKSDDTIGNLWGLAQNLLGPLLQNTDFKVLPPLDLAPTADVTTTATAGFAKAQLAADRARAAAAEAAAAAERARAGAPASAKKEVRFADEVEAKAEAEAEAARAEARVKAEARARAEEEAVARNKKFSVLKDFFLTSTDPNDQTDLESSRLLASDRESSRLLAIFKELTNPRQESTNHNKRDNAGHLEKLHGYLEATRKSSSFFNELGEKNQETQIKFYIKLIDYYDSEFLKKEQDQSDQSDQYYKDIATIQKNIEVYKDRAIELLDEYKTKKIGSFRETPYYGPSSPDEEPQQGQGLIVGPVTVAPPAKFMNLVSSFGSFSSLGVYLSKNFKTIGDSFRNLIFPKIRTKEEQEDEKLVLEEYLKDTRNNDIAIFGKSPEKGDESLIDFLNGKIKKLKDDPNSTELKTLIYQTVDNFVKKGSSDPKSPNFTDERKQKLRNALGANCVHVVDHKTNQQFFPTIKSEEEIESEKLKKLDDYRKPRIKVLEDFFDKNKQFKSDFIIDGKFEISDDKKFHKKYFNDLIEDELTAVIEGDKSTPLREHLHKKLSEDLSEKHENDKDYKQKFCDHLGRFSLSKIPIDIECEIIKDAQKNPEKYLFTNDRLRDLLQKDLHTLKIHKVIDDFSKEHGTGISSSIFAERETYRDGETKFKSGINYVIYRFQELSDQYLYRKEFVNDCKSAIKQLQEISESYEGLNKSGTSVKAKQTKQEKSPIQIENNTAYSTIIELTPEQKLEKSIEDYNNKAWILAEKNRTIGQLSKKDSSSPSLFSFNLSNFGGRNDQELKKAKKERQYLEDKKLELRSKIITNYKEIIKFSKMDDSINFSKRDDGIELKDNLKPLSEKEKEENLFWEALDYSDNNKGNKNEPVVKELIALKGLKERIPVDLLRSANKSLGGVDLLEGGGRVTRNDRVILSTLGPDVPGAYPRQPLIGISVNSYQSRSPSPPRSSDR